MRLSVCSRQTIRCLVTSSHARVIFLSRCILTKEDSVVLNDTRKRRRPLPNPCLCLCQWVRERMWSIVVTGDQLRVVCFLSPVSIQTQLPALRALRKRKPQETQALALTSSQSWLPLLRPSIPIGWRLRLLREWLAACQRKRLRLNGNRALRRRNTLYTCPESAWNTRQLFAHVLNTRRVSAWHSKNRMSNFRCRCSVVFSHHIVYYTQLSFENDWIHFCTML